MAYISTTSAPRDGRSLLGGFFAECAIFFDIVGAAIRVSSAVEGHSKPKSRDLRLLGIKELPSVR